jgi:hypothetical protein
MIKRLITALFSLEERWALWKTLPPGVAPCFLRKSRPSSPTLGYIPRATQDLIDETIACLAEISSTQERTEEELYAILKMKFLVEPSSFLVLMHRSMTKNKEFLHQLMLVRKWAELGPDAWCPELHERANRLLACGGEILRKLHEPSASTTAIENLSMKNAGSVRRRCAGD